MKKLILLSMLLGACATEDLGPKNTIVVDNVVINPYSYDVDPARIHQVFLWVQQYMVQVGFEDFDLNALTAKVELEVNYVDELPGMRGVFYASSNTIDVVVPDDSADIQCIETYYVLSHEMLHYANRRFLGNKNVDHSTPNLFVEWGYANDAVMDSAEYWLYLRIVKTLCAVDLSIL